MLAVVVVGLTTGLFLQEPVALEVAVLVEKPLLEPLELRIQVAAVEQVEQVRVQVEPAAMVVLVLLLFLMLVHKKVPAEL
jgi:hypothetical protein